MKLDYSDIHFADDGRLKLVIIVGTRIDKLRQFVDACFSHDVSPACLARVILGSLQRVGLCVHPHAPELIAVELLVVQPVSFLLEEHRSRHGQFGDNGHNEQDNREERTQKQQ